MVAAFVQSCNTDSDTDTWDTYSDWRNTNNAWLEEQTAKMDADGKPYYQSVTPSWDGSSYVLMHWFNDRSATEKNLTPFITSTVDVKYILHTCDGTAQDSSFLLTTNGDSIYRTKLTSVVTGWAIALTSMHVGDSCEVIVPYQSGYGSVSTGNINPYSHLLFAIKLVDINRYEK